MNVKAEIKRSSDIIEKSIQDDFIINNKFYNKIKFDSKKLKSFFENEQPDLKIKKLINIIKNRISHGRWNAIKDWRLYAAIDKSYEVSFSQVSYSIINYLFDRYQGDKLGVFLKRLEKWGIPESMACTEIETKEGVKKYLDRKMFHEITVPIVKPYLSMRAARIFNERDNYPLFLYTPARINEENEAVGKIITELVEKISVDYGYRDLLRQVVVHTLKYSFSLLFPMESWHYVLDIDDNNEEFTVKEGLRYSLPHPTMCYIDPSYRPSTVNTDTGCEYVMYWELYKYGDVISNELYYNRNKITYGSDWFGSTEYPSLALDEYWLQMNPCYMTTITKDIILDSPWSSAMGSDSRQHAQKLYTESDYDKVVLLTNYFMKLIPSQWGLSDYKYPVWIRFVVASDDTIIFCEPVPYCPAIFFGYDYDDNLIKNPSFALECIPWQNLVSRLLRQHMVTVRQNLLKVIPYDKDQINQDQIQELMAKGKELIEAVWIPFSGREMSIKQQDPQSVFRPIQFTQQNSTEIITILNSVVNLMERALQMSAQEVGGIAGHVQSAQEIKTIMQYMSNRSEFTGSYLDSGIDAWKRQIYLALRTFMDEEFAVEVIDLQESDVKTLKEKLNFEVVDKGNNKFTVKGQKSKISVTGFLSSREGNLRLDMPQIAKVMFDGLSAIIKIPDVAARVGPEWITKAINRIMKTMGAPEDFQVELSPQATTLAELKMVQAQLEQMYKQIIEAAKNAALEEVGKQIAPIIKNTQEQLQQTQQGVVQTAEQIKQTQQGVVETAQQTQQTQQGVVEVAQQTQQTQQGVVEVAQQVQQTQQAVMQTAQQIEQLKQGFGQSAVQLQEIGNVVKQLMLLISQIIQSTQSGQSVLQGTTPTYPTPLQANPQINQIMQSTVPSEDIIMNNNQ